MQFKYTWPGLVDEIGRIPSNKFETENSNWNGGIKSYTELTSLLLNGWNEGMMKAREISSPIIDRITSQIIRYDNSYQVEGHFIDVARFLENEPECWVSFEETKVEGRGNQLVHLTYNPAFTYDVEPEHVIKQGAHVCALIELLEYSGKSVKLDVSYGGTFQKSREHFEFTTTIKNFGDSFDFGRVMFAFSHPAFLRVCVIDIRRELISDKDKKRHGTFGNDGLRVIPSKSIHRADIEIDGKMELNEKTILYFLENQEIKIKKGVTI